MNGWFFFTFVAKCLSFFLDIWGPFLVITPASTLHNWQQEVAKFVPNFKVVPYWGSPQERKTLRLFWDQKNLHSKNASFHLVITSYQVNCNSPAFDVTAFFLRDAHNVR